MFAPEEEGIRLEEQALARARQVGDRQTIANVLTPLSYALVVTGQQERAIALAEEAVTLFRGRNQGADVVNVVDTLARGKLSLGDVDGARSAWRERLPVARDHGYASAFPYYLEGLAGVAAHQGDPRRAARLFAAAEVLRNRTGAPLPPGEHGPRDQEMAPTIPR